MHLKFTHLIIFSSDITFWQAQQTILEAEKCDIDSPHTYYLKFKIALIQNQEFEGKLAKLLWI